MQKKNNHISKDWALAKKSFCQQKLYFLDWWCFLVIQIINYFLRSYKAAPLNILKQNAVFYFEMYGL